MSDKSNNQGRAFEYACLSALENSIKEYRKVEIVENSCYQASFNAWNTLQKATKSLYYISAKSMISTLFQLEPLLIEDDNEILKLMIQPDSMGELGDVRDILAIRNNIQWEIGFSVKHNHLAVKHSRLSKNLDFGERWYGINCSENYWNDVSNIFKYLEKEKNNKTLWRELPDKELDVYVPLLNAFVEEIKRAYKEDENLPRKMVEYLLGTYDFYKVISIDKDQLTQLQTFNMKGTLNKNSKKQKVQITIPVVNLPTRLVNIEVKPGSTNKVELYLDNGWQFSFRIHNASTIVEPSLKFDIQIEGMPTSIMSINCLWANVILDKYEESKKE